MSGGVSRRECLAGLLLSSRLTPASAQAKRSDQPRLVVLDWGLTSTVLALGIEPVGIAEIELYRRWADDYPVPPGIQEVGLRTEPNLEVVAALKPDLIITTPFSESVRAYLERIAPTRSFATYTPAGQPLSRSMEVMREIAREVGAVNQAEAVLARIEASLAAARRSLEGRQIEPLLLAGFMDARHVRIYGPDSLFGTVMSRLGIPNAWDRLTNFWGFSLIGIHELAGYPEARLLAIAPVPADAPMNKPHSGLWRTLPFVRAGRVGTLPPCWAFGDVSAAERFAKILTHALLSEGGQHAG
jgi:ferric hydroxamate transport system substrate-binding protein